MLLICIFNNRKFLSATTNQREETGSWLHYISLDVMSRASNATLCSEKCWEILFGNETGLIKLSLSPSFSVLVVKREAARSEFILGTSFFPQASVLAVLTTARSGRCRSTAREKKSTNTKLRGRCTPWTGASVRTNASGWLWGVLWKNTTTRCAASFSQQLAS